MTRQSRAKYQVIKLERSDKRSEVPEGEYYLLCDNAQNPQELYLVTRLGGEGHYTPYDISSYRLSNIYRMNEIETFVENENGYDFSLGDELANSHEFNDVQIDDDDNLFFSIQDSIVEYNNPETIQPSTPVPRVSPGAPVVEIARLQSNSTSRNTHQEVDMGLIRQNREREARRRERSRNLQQMASTRTAAPPPPSIARTGGWTTETVTPTPAQSNLSADAVASAMRLLMKAYRDSQKVWPRASGATARNGWRREAFRILGVSENSDNLMSDIKNKISHLRSVNQYLRNHYARARGGRRAVDSRVNQASQLFYMIREGKTNVTQHEWNARDTEKSAVAFNQIINKNVIEQERSRGSRSTQVVNLQTQQPDTVQDFMTRLTTQLPISQSSDIIATQQTRNLRARIGDQKNFGGPIFEEWLRNKGETRESIAEKIQPVIDNPAILSRNGNASSLSQIFNDLSEIFNLCCDPTNITEDRSAIDNIANAFRGYSQGLNLGSSSSLYKKFIDQKLLANPNIYTNQILTVFKDAIDDGLLQSRAQDTSSTQLPSRDGPATLIPGAIAEDSSTKDGDPYGLLNELVQGFKEKGIKHVFFDLDDTLIKHAIKDMDFMRRIFGQDVEQYTSSRDPRSYAHPDRQGFYHDRAKRKEIADRVTDPELVSAFMYALKDVGIEVHINTLNSSTLAKVLCEEHDWPVSSISATDGQIIGERNVKMRLRPETNVSSVLNTQISTEGSPRKIAATARIVGGEQNLRQVAFFDDDFSKFSPTCNYLEAKGAMCFMKGRERGARFDSNHPNFEKELKEKLEELQTRSPATTPARPSVNRFYSRAHLQATTK